MGGDGGIWAGLCIAAVVCLTLFVTLLTVARRRRSRRRWTELRQFAARNGWTLVPDPQVEWGLRMPGRNKRGVSFALFGEMWGRRVSGAEYSYTETSTTGETTVINTHEYVLVVQHLDRPSGYLGVQTRGLLSRWGRSLFGTGTSIGDPRFDRSSRWSVIRRPRPT